jgi:hypothetical protein
MAKRKTARDEIADTAERVTHRLFGLWHGGECHRLVQVFDRTPSDTGTKTLEIKQVLGGWCKEAVRRVVHEEVAKSHRRLKQRKTK